MPIKLMAFLKATPGMDRSRFARYYEEKHAPLILEIMPAIIDYRRNYLPQSVAGFDVITEIWFEDRASFDAAMAVATAHPASELIASDEANFLDRAATVVVLPEEHGGPTA